MRIIFSILILITMGFNQSYAEDNKSYSPAEVYFLSTVSSTYFYSDHLTAARYSKFSPDGHYIYILKGHMGVSPVDEGTWSQTKDGTITLISPDLFADILCEPFLISVNIHRKADLLPELRQKIDEFLRSNIKERYDENELKGLVVKIADRVIMEVKIDWETGLKSATREELQALLNKVDEYIKNPSLRNIQLVPLSYKGKVFLIALNEIVNRDYKAVCDAIDGDTKRIIFNDFMITEEEFNKGTEHPYPFKFYPEMNKITGAE